MATKGVFLTRLLSLAGGLSAFLVALAFAGVVSAGPRSRDGEDEAPPRPPPTVFVKTISVVGASVFPREILDRVTSRFEGRRHTVRRLKGIARELEAFYHQEGYLLARAFLPAQEVTDGKLFVHVVEGHYGRVLVEGNRYYSSQFIRRLFWPARRCAVVERSRLERALLILNEFPDLTVQSVFRAGDEPGVSDVVIKVRDTRPLHAELALDNFGNRLIGEARVTAGATAGNTLIEGDRLVLRATQVVSGDSDPFLQVDYGWPVDHYGRRVSFGYANASTRVGEELSILDIRGTADIFSLTVWTPLARTVRINSDLSLAIVTKDVENFIFGTSPTTRDNLRNLVLTYDQSWLDAAGRTVLVATATQGLGEGFGGTANGAPEASRTGAGSKFTRLTGDLVRLMRISPANQILLRATGQVASRPLLVPEQFSLGGADSVRGYAQSEFLGDNGFTASAEYRRTFYEADGWVVQGIAFVDTGFAFNERPQANEREDLRLTGAGFGLRAQLGYHSTLRLDAAVPLDPSQNANGDSSAFYAQLTTRL